MFYFQAIVSLICVALMFISKRETKFIIFLSSFLCMNLFTLNVGPYSSLRVLLIIAYCISEWRSLTSSFSELKKQKIFWPVVLMIIPITALFLNSPHYSGVSGFIKIIINDIFFQYLMLWVGYTVFAEGFSWRRIYKVFYYCVIIITIFAILNIVLQSVPWKNIGGNLHYDEAVYQSKTRFNVCSIFSLNFIYGFMCIMSLAYGFYGYMNGLLKSRRWYLILSMCIFGILVCGSRTVWVSSMIFALFALFSNKNIKAIKYSALACVCIIIAYMFVPSVTSRVDMLVDTFNEDSEVSGSSLGMREMQYNAVLTYINNHQLFGRGYKFFYYDLGWAQFHSGGRVDADLRGIEGIYLEYLLERGWFGYISYLIFYIYLGYMLLKSNLDKIPKYMALSVVSVYVAFAHMTGDLGTAHIALFFVGTFIKFGVIDNLRKKEAYYDC